MSVSLPRQLVRGARRHLRQRRAATRQPPSCPPEWQTGPPDFVGVGAQRAGTSWWYTMLEAHSRVQPSPVLTKELHFFDNFWQAPFSSSDVEHYHRFFPRARGCIAGEWTPRYMFDFWTPPLLAAAAPQAKILVMLRDPVERYRSGLTHDLQLGERFQAATANGAFLRGLYGPQVRRLFDCFPQEQILVLQYERCRDDPPRELRRTHQFLGLTSVEPEEALLTGTVNESKGTKLPLDDRLRERLVSLYAEDVAALATVVPELRLSLWPNFSHLA